MRNIPHAQVCVKIEKRWGGNIPYHWRAVADLYDLYNLHGLLTASLRPPQRDTGDVAPQSVI